MVKVTDDQDVLCQSLTRIPPALHCETCSRNQQGLTSGLHQEGLDQFYQLVYKFGDVHLSPAVGPTSFFKYISDMAALVFVS